MNEYSDMYLGGSDAAAADSGSGFSLGGLIDGLTGAAKAAGQVYKDISNAPANASNAGTRAAAPLPGMVAGRPFYAQPLVLIGAGLVALVGLWLLLRNK